MKTVWIVRPNFNAKINWTLLLDQIYEMEQKHPEASISSSLSLKDSYLFLRLLAATTPVFSDYLIVRESVLIEICTVLT